MPNAMRVLRGFALVFFVTGIVAVAPTTPDSDAGPRAAYAPGEVLVRFKKSAGTSGKAGAFGKAKCRGLRHLSTQRDDARNEPGIWHVATGMSVEDAVASLQSDPNVEFAEPNWLVTHTDASNDPSYVNGSLWGMYGDDVPVAGPAGTTNVYGCDAEEAWGFGKTGAASVYVGVIDEGIDFTHPELAPNLWINPFEAWDGIDNDGNGYVDDVRGWDFFRNDHSVFDPADIDDHGTHVAGTIGARGGNGAGVAGVNWNVTMIPAKFLGPSGGSTAGAVAALNYLRDLRTRHGLKIVATSNSWGGGGYSASLHVAILKAAKEGILFVAAAGNSNSNNDAVASYPSNYSTLVGSGSETAASYEAVIAVAAITSTGTKASFSSYGATTVDLGAPGQSVLSTVPSNGYAYYSGTSMATPHVSGAVALYAAAFPSATAAQIRDALLANAKPTPSLAGITVTGGRLNLGGLFGSAPPPPPPPPTVIRDIAVTSISIPPSPRHNTPINVTIGLANQGTATETFQVSLSATGGSVGSPATVTLGPGALTSIVIVWFTPPQSATHTVTATASILPGETDTADNTRSAAANVH